MAEAALVPKSICPCSKYALCAGTHSTLAASTESISVSCRFLPMLITMELKHCLSYKTFIGRHLNQKKEREQWPPEQASSIMKHLGSQHYKDQAEECLFMDWKGWALGCPGYSVVITVLSGKDWSPHTWQLFLSKSIRPKTTSLIMNLITPLFDQMKNGNILDRENNGKAYLWYS